MSTDNKPTVQQAAKQGNLQAIAILLNRQLQPKGITAKVSAKNSCLQIMLEAANVPNQKALVTALQKWIDGLGCDSIQRVQIYAKQTGEDIPEWNDSFEVVRQLEEQKIAITVSSPTIASETSKNDVKVEEISASNLDPVLLELAKNGDTKAISELIKNSLKQLDVKVRVTLSKGLLQIVIVSNQEPKQDTFVEDISNLVKEWNSTLIEKLKIVGMRETEESADSNIYWMQEYMIVKQSIQNTNNNQEDDIQEITQSNSNVSKYDKQSFMTNNRDDLLPDERIILSKTANAIIKIDEYGLSRFAFNQLMVFVGMQGKEAIGGQLILTNYRLIFKSHIFNRLKGKFSIFLSTINDIKDTSIFISKKIEVSTQTQKFEFIVWGIPELIAAIKNQKSNLSTKENEILCAIAISHYKKFGDNLEICKTLEAINVGILTIQKIQNTASIAENIIEASSILNLLEMFSEYGSNASNSNTLDSTLQSCNLDSRQQLNETSLGKLNQSFGSTGFTNLVRYGFKGQKNSLPYFSKKSCMSSLSLLIKNKKLIASLLVLVILFSGLLFLVFNKKKLIDSPIAKNSLTELKKINSRMDIGISLLEYPKEVSNYKFATETFIDSKDSTINSRYTKLMKDALEAHIYALNVWEECQKQRLIANCEVEESMNGETTRKSYLMEKLLTRYPYLNEKLKTYKSDNDNISFVAISIDKNDVIQYLWSYAKAAEDAASIELSR
ncbi:GRAM domain-containing protein [Pseudanabaena mucicola]|uniref:GRAM domain-containing protein n=1 Tax=Pseudanabaena mucicola FACHB-723 TaxID=2692860 RepID=A0ABR8A142_9CYAN|nr:GRAM domain-containing protein [Pseudanabaena mucicola]MBD2189465.1 hypothetical protein [Pseudanabaena mucicola FACHB-723]